MKIHFQGLIVHADIDIDDMSKQLAVLMAMEDHVGWMTVNTADLRAALSAVPERLETASAGVACFPLVGLVTTDAGWGTARNSPPSIPQPRKLKTGQVSLDPDVVARRAGAKFAAFIELPDGTFSVKDYYPNKVTFANVDYGCLARTITYDPKTTADIAFTIHGTGKTVTIAADAEIYITNTQSADSARSSLRHAMAMPSHYDAYKNLFEPPATSIYPPVDTSIPCPSGSVPPPRPTCIQPADLQVDCSNTRFP
jgi:hypothetical protein